MISYRNVSDFIKHTAAEDPRLHEALSRLDGSFVEVYKTINNLNIPKIVPTIYNTANVKENFGAKADGVMDDTTSVKRAFASGKPAVYFPNGTYIIAGPIQPPANLLVFGNQATLKVKDGNNNNMFEIFSDNVHFDNLIFDGNKANQSAGSLVLYHAAKRFSARNLIMLNPFTSGILVEVGSDIGIIQGCRIEGAGDHAINLSSSNRMNVINNIVIDPGASGVNVSTCLYVNVVGTVATQSVVETSGFGGVRFSNGSKFFNAVGNTISDFTRGIFITTGSIFGTVVGNTIDGAGSQGMLIEGINPTFNLFLVVNNNVIRNIGKTANAEGIRLVDSLYCDISNNVIIDDRGTLLMDYGIKASGTSDRLNITDNIINGITTRSIDIPTGGNFNLNGNIIDPAESINIASAATITLINSGTYFNITGTTNITSVTASWVGRTVTLRFAGILTFTNGSNLKLNGNFVTAADSTISLICNGTNWYEVARKP